MLRTNESIALYCIQCSNCGNQTDPEEDRITNVIYCLPSFKGLVASYIHNIMLSTLTSSCGLCNDPLQKIVWFKDNITLLAVELNNANISISKKMKIPGLNSCVLNLKGIIYYADFHFTCRIITTDQMV